MKAIYNISKNPGGRPTAFESEDHIWSTFQEYVKDRESKAWTETVFTKMGPEIIEKSLPLTVQSFCIFAGISSPTFYNYLKKGHKFFNICTRIKEECEVNMFDGASIGAFNHAIIARKLGLADKQEIQATGEAKVIHVTPASSLNDKNHIINHE